MKKKDTPPPSFPLETPKGLCDTHSNSIREKISLIVTPIFEKVLQEHHLNHRMVGFNPSIPTVTFLWQPHNYRLYFDFSKENFKQKKPSNHTLQKHKSMVAIFNTAYTYTSLNYDSEHEYKDFMFCTIRVKKNQIEVTNHSHLKQWRKITAESADEVDERINVIMNDLKEQSIKALKSFIQLHGGKSKFNILNERCEHGIHGDDYLDKIPEELIIHDTYIKKPYLEKTEFKTTAAIKNYVSNRAVEKIYPEIALEINKLNQKYELFENSIGLYNKQIQLHLNVMRNINASLSHMDSTMIAIKEALSPLKEHYPQPDDIITFLFNNPLELAKFKLMSKSEQNKILFGDKQWKK